MLYARLLDKTVSEKETDNNGYLYTRFPIREQMAALSKSDAIVIRALLKLEQAGLLERKRQVVFECGNYQNTIKRLCLVAALTPVAEAKALFYQFSVWVLEEMTGKDYPVFSNSIRMEMEIYEFVVWLSKKQIMEG